MSFKSKVLAGAATLALVGGVQRRCGRLSANAATPSCGGTVHQPLQPEVQHAPTKPNFVLDVFRQGAKVGQPIILFQTSNTDPAEDFTVSSRARSPTSSGRPGVSAVELHFGGGLGTSTSANDFPDDPAFELEYSPYGVDSGLCVGVASTAAQGSKVSLQPCGVSAKTVWITDAQDIERAGVFTFATSR